MIVCNIIAYIVITTFCIIKFNYYDIEFVPVCIMSTCL